MTSLRTSLESVVPDRVSATSPRPGAAEGVAWRWFAAYGIALLVASRFGDGAAANLYSAIGTFAFLPLNIGATYWLFRASRNPVNAEGEGLGLRLLGVMYVFTAIGNTIWSADQLRGIDPYASTSNLFYIGSYVAGIAAMTRFPLAPPGTHEFRKVALDVACVMISIGALVWTFIIVPLDWAGVDRSLLALNLAYPLSCIVLLAMLCRLLMRQAPARQYTSLAIVTAAIFAQCTIDLILELDYRNRITSVTAWVAAICPALYIVIIYGAERLARRTDDAPAAPPRDPALNPINLLPTISAISVYTVLIWAVQTDRRAPLGVLLAAAILLNVLFLAKQTLAAREHAALVQQRADAESRARYEELAREGQKLEAVGRLAGGIAHDFNNLLTTVLANSEFALTRLRPGAVGHDEVSDIRGAALRAAELIRQLLAFSRKSITAPVVLQPDVVLREMERLLQRLAGDQCQLLLTMQHDLGAVRTDRSQLEQAVDNLVTNARDAMPNGGVIVINGRNTTLDAAAASALDLPAGAYVALTVQDSGTGIAPEVRGQIFEPFFSTKPRGKGTGLGLASAYGIMRQSHGAIGVETQVGEGSRFTLYLPRQATILHAVVPTDPPAVPDAALAATAGATVLLVEDEADVRQVTQRILESEGYVVLTAPDARSARRVLETHGHTIAMLVTDVIMPGESGIDLAAHVRTHWPRVPVLFISGYSDSDLPANAIRAEDVLQKPFSGAALVTRVAATLAGTRPAPSVVRSR